MDTENEKIEDEVKEEENAGSKKLPLMAQLIRFALVGGTSFVIDFLITLLVSSLLRKMGSSVEASAAVGGVFGFSISLIYNYFMSMKFVFERRDDMGRKKEFIIFTVLSLIGLGINELILYFGVIACNNMVPTIVDEYPTIVTAGVKIVATGIVMIYNFVSRKLTLEKKD